MKTIGYIRVSMDKQDVNNQKLAIMDYARKNNFKINDFVDVKISSRRSTKARRLDELINILENGDRLIVSELSRIGRSLGQIIQFVDTLIKKNVKFIALKQGIFIDGKQTIQTKVTVGLFGLFAEIERDLISERTKQGIIAARMKGKLIGRPKGSVGKSKLDGKEEEIQNLIDKEVSITAISKILDVSRGCLYKFIKKKKIQKTKM
jgi:DNA invertase Pin-like site-specific DNA recombinase